MKSLPTALSGPILAEPEVHRDERGFFLESYRREAYDLLGITADFVQDNQSRSVQGALRGMHFQLKPGQPKLVRVARGAIFDVVVDLRRSSPTFGKWEGFELDDITFRQLYVPIGFAHGFCVLSDAADVAYKVGSYYDPTEERGIAWDDPDVAIEWPVSHPRVSNRDQAQPLLKVVVPYLPEW